MKKLILFITIGFISATTFAQGIDDYNYNAWEHPIIKQLQAKSNNVIGYCNNDKWINIAILDKTTKMLYWINCSGFVIDKATVSEIAYNKLLKRQLDPFEYHQILWETGLELIDAAIYKFRFPKTIFKYAGITDFDKHVQEEYQIPTVKSAKTPLEKLAALYEQRQINLFNLARCKANHPDKVKTDSEFVQQIANTQKGMIKVLGNADMAKSVVFYNTNSFSSVYKAVLKIPSSKLYFYTQNQAVFDSLNILPQYIPKLINEKTNVFALYQNLNAWRLTQIDSIGQLLTNYSKTPNKKASIFIQTLLKTYQENSEELWLSILTAQKKYVTNLNVLNGIDNYYFEQGVKYYLSKENPVTMGQYQANSGTIFTYTLSTEQRGNKLYELDDHRGNVMAVISDKKNGVDSNNDGKVDYYEPDVVKATDYSSFGMPLPGRTFQIKEYDYSFNGKRDDNETGYQDYGQRMYDPNIGRFISVDPITKQYAGLTPYQFASNRVIDGIDLDGAEYSTSGKYFSSPEGLFRVDTKIMITITNSSKVISNVQTIDSYKTSIKRTIAKDQSGGVGTANDPIVTTKVEEISNGPLIINLVDATSKNGMVTTGYTYGEIGQTQKNVTDVSITIDGTPRATEDVGRTSSHEQGHVGGLKHPFHGAPETDIGVPLGPLPTWQNNLMNSFGGSSDPNAPDYNPIPSTSGHIVTPQQRETITNQIENDVKKQTKPDVKKN